VTRTKRPGEVKLAAAVRRFRRAAPPPGVKGDPKPYDHSWGWWVEQRLGRLESQLAWLIRLALATLAGEVIRIIIGALNLQSP
jgi:hypothetical protein